VRAAELRTVIEYANRIIDGTFDATIGSRILAPVLRRAGLDCHPDGQRIKMVDDELDVYPLGPVREHWHPDALAELDAQRERYEAEIHDSVVATCKKIVRVATERIVPEPTEE
jgi:hypothetical protein